MGNTVTKQFPNDYIVTVATNVNTLIDEYNNVINVLSVQQTEITALQTQVQAILTSGATAIPQVNAHCLSSPADQVQPINVVVTELVSNTCDYNTVLGTPSKLTQAIIAGNWSYLNTQPAFSQNSAMAGLTGWISSPLTIADGFNNSLLSYLDARAGIAKALSTNLCAQNTIDFAVTLPSFGTGFNIFFSGYTFIATGFSDAGSTIRITDSNGNTALNAINLVTLSTAGAQPYNFATSGTTLQQGLTYTIYLNSDLTAAANTTCEKTTVHTMGIPQQTVPCCPDIGNYSALYTSGTTTVALITGLSYTPRFVTIEAKNEFTANNVMSQGFYFTYSLGGATVTWANTPSSSGTLNIDWIAFR